VQLLFLDASKAFDKVIPSSLCSKLLDRGVPAAEVKLLHSFLTSASGQVKFGGSRSSVFLLEAGVRQGSLLGGLLWNIYVDSLISELKISSLGCHFGEIWSGAFLYADDICLVSSTTAGLNGLIQITVNFAKQHQVRLNPLKSRVMVSGPSKRNNLQPVIITGQEVKEVNVFRYLGFELTVSLKGKLTVAVKPALGKLYRAANSILAIPGCTKPLLRLRLIKAVALPHVDYVLSLWRFITPVSRKLLSSAVNRVLRRCLGLHHNCSGDLVCWAAGVTTSAVRAGHLLVFPAMPTVSPHLGEDTRAVCQLRVAGLQGRIAASLVAWTLVSDAHAVRARFIKGLLSTPDKYARRMAYNISVPTSFIG
jgi:hypothetical protein